MKELMTYEKLIQEKIKDKGITTNSHSDLEILEILSNKNYFFRLMSYRKNFQKNQEKLYINLDFEALVDMSSIDLYLKEYLFSLTLDVEHSAKTLLMDLITTDPSQDGYLLIRKFKDYDSHTRKAYDRAMFNFRKSTYLKDMYNKKTDEIPIWVFLEIIDMGTLIRLIDLYSHDKNNDAMQQFNKTLKFVKNIRNTSAHNNIFLVNVYADSLKMKRNTNPISEVVSFAKAMNINDKQLKYLKVNDLVALFYMHKRFSSDSLNNRRYKEGQILLDRFKRNQNLYKSSEVYSRFLPTLEKLVDFLRV